MELEQLRTLLHDIYAGYLRDGCPCRFPRFRKLVSFNFQDHGIGPTGCCESEMLIRMARTGPDAVYAATAEPAEGPDAGKPHKCTRCGAQITEYYEDYSISMYRTYLRFERLPAADLGADVELPMPLINGFYGFRRDEWSALDGLFRRGSSVEAFVQYMTARRPAG